MDIAVISSLEDAEGITAGRDIDQVSLQINIDTPLKDAADIKCKTRAGTLGFPVVNPELLDCKCVAKNELEKKFDLMLKQWMRYCENEMNAVDLLIATVKQNLAIPADNVPPHGPPLAERIRGIHQCIYLESLCGPHPSYDYGAPPPGFQPPYGTQEQRLRARQREEESQRAWWNVNLSFLEAKKKALETRLVFLRRRSEPSWTMP
ncbi:hypothetical protein BRADI_5g15880v3 [Brachypodium distachyon]|uniref:Uncharacterized protein n=1 Tax=Brachypodium distachyon TaxID=15368 RepID=I1IZQ6_BRADI|nr:hypothetical protein BRADI_5g15880v3 [Brachypodium distachyon]